MLLRLIKKVFEREREKEWGSFILKGEQQLVCKTRSPRSDITVTGWGGKSAWFHPEMTLLAPGCITARAAGSIFQNMQMIIIAEISSRWKGHLAQMAAATAHRPFSTTCLV